MSNSSRNGRNDSGSGCIAVFILAIIAMPIVGIYLACTGEDKGQKWLGVVLTIVGVIVYAKMGIR